MQTPGFDSRSVKLTAKILRGELVTYDASANSVEHEELTELQIAADWLEDEGINTGIVEWLRAAAAHTFDSIGSTELRDAAQLLEIASFQETADLLRRCAEQNDDLAAVAGPYVSEPLPPSPELLGPPPTDEHGRLLADSVSAPLIMSGYDFLDQGDTKTTPEASVPPYAIDPPDRP